MRPWFRAYARRVRTFFATFLTRSRQLLLISALLITSVEQASADPPLIDGADREYRDALIEAAAALDLHARPEWLLLLHYDDPVVGSRKSQANTERFFASPVGRTDPKAELAATLAGFFEALPRPGSDDPLQCAFVARFAWLDHELHFDDSRLPRLACENFARWRTGLAGDQLTLIFPESFMASPASMFGHTLLRLDDAKAEGGLLGYAIDFSGDIGDDGIFEYLVKGVAGFYPGYFAVSPYYEKLERYSDWENRDIWEYTLDLEPEEVDFVLMHLWELRGISFPYYFFGENCSYQLLRLLEVARPDSHISEGFPFAVIPVDTVRALAEAGWVSEARYRPSPATKLRVDAAALSPALRSLARDIARGRVEPSSDEVGALEPLNRAVVLSIAYKSLRFDFLSSDGSDTEARDRSRRILIARSRLGRSVKGDPLADSVPVPRLQPEEGHATARVSLASGWRDGDAYVEARFRAALHDFMDPQDGYPRGSQIQVLDTRLRFIPDGTKVRLEELVVLDIVSLPPRSEFFRPIAWKASTGLRTRLVRDSGDGDFDPKPMFRTNGGAGLAVSLGNKVLAYAFGDATLDVGSALSHDVSFGPGVTIGFYVDAFGDLSRTHFFGGVTRFAVGDETTWYRGGLEQRLSIGTRGAIHLRGTANRQDGDEWFEAGATASFYF